MIRTRDTYKTYYNEFYRSGDFQHYPDRVNAAYIGALLQRFGIPSGSRVLDMGCGTGMQLDFFSRLGMSAVGLELSIEGLQAARKRVQEALLVNGDGFMLPFPSGIFRAVFSFASLLNYSNEALMRTMLGEMLRVIAPGGWMILVTISDYSGKEKGGWFQRTDTELRNIASSVPAISREIIRTIPRLTALWPALAFHPVFSAALRLAFGYKRTIILAFQKQ
jgi:ubiquinone/menaquinone biosynthesis C-methylase UbiE